MVLNEDVLQCTTAELSYGLCCFINEVKRPNGEPYSPDSLFYLCLGIQQVGGSASISALVRHIERNEDCVTCKPVLFVSDALKV